jgi:hypothetical protein
MHWLQTLPSRSDGTGRQARTQFTTIDENRGHRVVKSLLNPIAIGDSRKIIQYIPAYFINTQRPPSVKRMTRFITTNIES